MYKFYHIFVRSYLTLFLSLCAGTVVNISDAYQHPKFFQAVDKNTGFHTKNILCFPIMLEQEIVGVAQLCNKINGQSNTQALNLNTQSRAILKLRLFRFHYLYR